MLPLLVATAEFAEMLQVALGDGGDVAAVEDTDFEVLRRGIAGRQLGAGSDEVFEVLVDDLVGADVRCDLVGGLSVGNKVLLARQVDAVEMLMPVQSLSVFFNW